MTPFVIEKLILQLKRNIDEVQQDIIGTKYKFCVEFEKELSLPVGEYSQTVFDYLFNLFFFKKAFGEKELRRYLDEFRDMNFTFSSNVCHYISNKYLEFISIYKKYFMDYMGFNHEDSLYIHRKILANKGDFVQKIMEYNKGG